MKLNEPLGMPQGTVRAILALIVVLGALASVFIHVDPTDKTFIFSMAGVAFGYYFGARQAETAEHPRSESEILSAPKVPKDDPEPDETVGVVSGKELSKDDDY